MLLLDDLRTDLSDLGWRNEVYARPTQIEKAHFGSTGKITISFVSNYWNGEHVDFENIPRVTVSALNSDDLYTSTKEATRILFNSSSFPLVPHIEMTPVATEIKELREPKFEKGDDALYIQQEMLAAGWGFSDSFDGVMGDRKIFRRVSFERPEWHGKLVGSDVTFFHLGPMAINWDITTYQVATRALQAYEDFPAAIPMVDSFDRVVEDKFKTRIVFGE